MDGRNLLLAKISYMYYIDDLSQQQIANILNISRPTISRALAEAREKGIVEIKVHSPMSRNFSLEKELKSKFSLKEAVVISVISTKDENINKSLGEAAAHYLYENVKDGMTIGLSMGKTLNEMANALKECEMTKKVKCNTVPIVGGTGYKEPQLHANEICRKAAEALGGDFFPIYVPAIAEDEIKRNAFMEDPLVQKIFDITLESDMTFVSVGNVSSSTFLKIGSIKKEESENLKKQGIVGDIGSWFFDKDGNFPDVDINKRIVGVNFNELRKKSRIVLVAGTENKKEIIKSSLKGKWVDVLITDEYVCKYLLDE